jgi:hypothetical protein
MKTNSNFLVLLPPNAIPELQSSRFAQISMFPPNASEIRGRTWIGEGPKRKSALGIEAKGSGSWKVAMVLVGIEVEVLEWSDKDSQGNLLVVKRVKTFWKVI